MDESGLDWKHWFNTGTAFLLGGAVTVIVTAVAASTANAPANTLLIQLGGALFVVALAFYGVAYIQYMRARDAKHGASAGAPLPELDIAIGCDNPASYQPIYPTGELLDFVPTLISFILVDGKGKMVADLTDVVNWNSETMSWDYNVPPELVPPKSRGQIWTTQMTWIAPNGVRSYHETRFLIGVMTDGGVVA